MQMCLVKNITFCPSRKSQEKSSSVSHSLIQQTDAAKSFIGFKEFQKTTIPTYIQRPGVSTEGYLSKLRHLSSKSFSIHSTKSQNPKKKHLRFLASSSACQENSPFLSSVCLPHRRRRQKRKYLQARRPQSHETLTPHFPTRCRTTLRERSSSSLPSSLLRVQLT